MPYVRVGTLSFEPPGSAIQVLGLGDQFVKRPHRADMQVPEFLLIDRKKVSPLEVRLGTGRRTRSEVQRLNLEQQLGRMMRPHLIQRLKSEAQAEIGGHRSAL